MSSSSPAPDSWIASFCSVLGHEYFAEVSEDFIEDDFNLTGLQTQVPMYKEALEMILDVEPEDEGDSMGTEEEEDDEDEDEDDVVLGDNGKASGYRRAAERRHMRVASDLSVIESSAEMLYGLIHQRYITSRPGIQQMAEKYDLQHFGVCPRVYCNGCRVLPVGHSDVLGQDTVKLFCPSCLDIYTPPNSRFQSVDGAFFGTTFGCLFFMTFPELDVGARAEGLQLPPTNGTASDKPRASPLPSVASAPPPTNGGSDQAAPANEPAVINGMTTTNLAPGLGAGKIYEARIYGFRVSERARSGPRMRWLRSRPADMNDLDETRIWAEHNGLVSIDEGLEDEEAEDEQVEGADEDEEVEDEEMGDDGGGTLTGVGHLHGARYATAGSLGPGAELQSVDLNATTRTATREAIAARRKMAPIRRRRPAAGGAGAAGGIVGVGASGNGVEGVGVGVGVGAAAAVAAADASSMETNGMGDRMI